MMRQHGRLPSIVNNNAFLSDNSVVIAGFEEYPERDINNRSIKSLKELLTPRLFSKLYTEKDPTSNMEVDLRCFRVIVFFKDYTDLYPLPVNTDINWTEDMK